MSSTDVHSPGRDAAAGTVDVHFEVHLIPVSDVDRAKQFYRRLDITDVFAFRSSKDPDKYAGAPGGQGTSPGSPLPGSRPER